MVAFCAGMLDAMGVLGLVGLLDIGGYLLKEGSNVELSRTLFRVWLASRYDKLASRYVWLAWCINPALQNFAARRKSGVQVLLKRQQGVQATALPTVGRHLCLRPISPPFQVPIF